jgi:selenocysteine lyase/cysteine desulfurase
VADTAQGPGRVLVAVYGVFALAATARASVYLYNTPDDLDRLAAGIERAKRVFRV